MRATLLGLLRSRVGVAAVIGAVVLIVVGAFRLFGPPQQSPVQAGPRYTELPVLITHEPDDGVLTPPPVQSPSVAPGAATPIAVAKSFAESWVQGKRTPDAWLAALRPHCTQHLLEELRGADPASVPAARVTGEPTLIPSATTYAEVTIPLDAGVLRLRMLGPDGHWFVDGVDWGLT
jgi:hypothetical protein